MYAKSKSKAEAEAESEADSDSPVVVAPDSDNSDPEINSRPERYSVDNTGDINPAGFRANCRNTEALDNAFWNQKVTQNRTITIRPCAHDEWFCLNKAQNRALQKYHVVYNSEYGFTVGEICQLLNLCRYQCIREKQVGDYNSCIEGFYYDRKTNTVTGQYGS